MHRRTHVFHWNRKGIRRARNSWASLSGSSSICRWTHEVRPCRAGTLYRLASTPPKTQMCTNLSNNPSIFSCPLTGPSLLLQPAYELLCSVTLWGWGEGERGVGLRVKDLARENLRMRGEWIGKIGCGLCGRMMYCIFVDYLKKTIIYW